MTFSSLPLKTARHTMHTVVFGLATQFTPQGLACTQSCRTIYSVFRAVTCLRSINTQRGVYVRACHVGCMFVAVTWGVCSQVTVSNTEGDTVHTMMLKMAGSDVQFAGKAGTGVHSPRSVTVHSVPRLHTTWRTCGTPYAHHMHTIRCVARPHHVTRLHSAVARQYRVGRGWAAKLAGWFHILEYSRDTCIRY